jgi:hypothetical protein
MDELRTTFIVGFTLFVVGGVVTLLAYLYYLRRGHATFCLWQQQQKPCCAHLMWLKTQWLYVVLFTVFFMLSLLYMAQYLGQGFLVRLDGTVVLWLRLLVWALLALCFAYQITHILGNQGTSNADVRGFFLLLYSALALLFLFAATLSQTQGTRLLWVLASLIAALVTGGLWFMPSMLQSDTPVTELQAERQQTDLYRTLFVLLAVAVYVLTFVVWFLSASNQFTTAIDARGEAIAYLVLDLILTVPLLLFVAWRTFVVLQFQFKSYDPVTHQSISLQQRRQAATANVLFTR